MKPKLNRLIDSALTYRLDVSVFAYLITLVQLERLSTYSSAASAAIALSLSFLMSAVYVFNKSTDSAEDAVNHKSGPTLPKNAARIRYVSVLLFIAGLVTATWIIKPLNYVILYISTGLLGFLYSYPVTYRNKPVRLKQLLFIKTLSAAALWVSLPVGIRIALTNQITSYDLYLAVVLGAVVAAFEITWDIRDVAGDKKHNIRTIANTYDVRAAKITALCLLLCALILITLRPVNLISLLGITVSALFILFASQKSSKLYFHAMIIFWIIILTLRLVFV